MHLKHVVALAPLVLGLAACADFPGSPIYLDQLNAAAPSGSAFTKALAGEYKAFAQEERDEYDWAAQQRYAHKGLDAAHGTADEPENVADWSIADANAASELTAARTRLMTAIKGDAPARAPALTATAQVKFECWLHEQHEGWQTDEIAECRKDFLTAMDQLEAKPAPAAMTTPAPAPMAAPAKVPTSYLVFFDFDKSFLTADAKKIIATAAQAIKAGGSIKINVTGYTDTVGTIQYNQKLSERRADSVEQELVKDGIAAGNIAVAGKGKTDLLVPTADGVREPKNRRAVIEFAGP
jgi:OOP family OmpA-OmpF porin